MSITSVKPPSTHHGRTCLGRSLEEPGRGMVAFREAVCESFPWVEKYATLPLIGLFSTTFSIEPGGEMNE